MQAEGPHSSSVCQPERWRPPAQPPWPTPT